MAVVAAVVLTIFLVTRDDDPDPTASAGDVQTSVQPSEQTTPSASPTTTTPAVDPGPRNVTVVYTLTRVTPPPGYPEDPFFGSVGDEVTIAWRLTGPCDGAGPCELAVCETAECGESRPGEPQGAGYLLEFSEAVPGGELAPCSNGSVDHTFTWAVTGAGDAETVTGTWVQQSDEPVYTGTDGSECVIYLQEFSIASP